MDYSRFATEFSTRRKPAIIRDILNIRNRSPPDVIYFGGGVPNTETIPFGDISFKLKDGTLLNLDEESEIDALQYGPTEGYPPLRLFMKDFVQKYYSPPLWDQSDVIVTPGAQFAFYSAIDILLEVNDYIIINEPSYATMFNVLHSYNPKILSVGSDSKGMDPQQLREVLSKWNPEDVRNKMKGVPKVLYVNPSVNNPSGASLLEERKREIYKIASEYNIIILEDDPYYFLQFKDIKDYPPTFLSMDVDGRVLRFDSFSKLLSSGMRLGFVTGPKPLINRMVNLMNFSILHTSSLTQVIAYKILTHWGDEGFQKHVADIRKIYSKRKDAMVAFANKHLKGLCEWVEPAGGMFLWIKVPKLKSTFDMAVLRGQEKKVLFLPGSSFTYHSDKYHNYMRVSYSLVTEEEMDKGLQYLAELVKEELLIQEQTKG